jgi:predicted ferric reductase
MSAGRLALALFGVVIVTSLWRKPLRIEYDSWRVAHAVLATAAFLLAVGHITGVGYYTAAPWTRRLWTTYTLSHGLLIVYVRLAKPWTMRHRPYRVLEVRQERGRSWTLAVAPEGHAGLRFAPGQFAWLTLHASPFRLKEHPFSFSSSATDSGRIEFTIKDLGDFTGTIKTIQPGETAYLDGPYGVFSVDRHRDAPGFVFIAGGIGIAPIMSMLRTLADRGERRPLLLVYANNRWEEVVFREELERLRTRLALMLVHVLVEPPPGWAGETGFVTEALLERRLPPERRTLEYFLCGPKPMTDGVQRALRAQGVPLARQHFELFDMV